MVDVHFLAHKLCHFPILLFRVPSSVSSVGGIGECGKSSSVATVGWSRFKERIIVWLHGTFSPLLSLVAPFLPLCVQMLNALFGAGTSAGCRALTAPSCIMSGSSTS